VAVGDLILYFDEGRVIMDGTNVYFTETHLRDHLGNTRVVFGYKNNSLLVKQVSSYYPFGMNIKGLTSNSKQESKHPANEYLYNGKMFQDELGLDWLDYGARMYDAVLGRFHSVDPLAVIFASQSPYCYAANNPIKFIDYMGMSPKVGDEFGADGLTNKQWMESSRPGADPGLGKYYRNFNRNIESEKKYNGLQEDKNGNYFYYKQKSRKWGGMYRFSGKSYLYFGPGLEVVLEKEPFYPCPNCLDPSTLGQNFLWLSYPGGNNPRTYSGDDSYSYVPSRLSEYPAIGHDRRYNNLGIAGPKGLFTDTRAIGADWRFVWEELSIASNPFVDPISRMQAGILGLGVGGFALPKTIYQLGQNNGLININIWYNISNEGVSNTPDTYKH